VLGLGGAALAFVLVACIVSLFAVGALSDSPGQVRGQPAGGGAAVAPPGAPYAYRVPDGFIAVPASQVVVVGTALHRSAVRPRSGGGARDLVVVGVLSTLGGPPLDTDDFADRVDRSVRGNTADAPPARRTTVDGHAAVQYDLTLGSGVRSRSTFVLAGNDIVQVSCQQQLAAATVLEGCDSLLRSLTIRA